MERQSRLMKLSGAGENSREKGEKNRFGFLEGLRDLKVEVGPRFVMIVPNRRKETLLPTILERIRPGTTIMSDEWKAYSTLNLHNYVHKTVCHKRHFVDPESGACTNTIEGL